MEKHCILSSKASSEVQYVFLLGPTPTKMSQRSSNYTELLQLSALLKTFYTRGENFTSHEMIMADNWNLYWQLNLCSFEGYLQNKPSWNAYDDMSNLSRQQDWHKDLLVHFWRRMVEFTSFEPRCRVSCCRGVCWAHAPTNRTSHWDFHDTLFLTLWLKSSHLPVRIFFCKFEF